MRNGRLDLLDAKSVPLSALEASPYFIQPGDSFIIRGNGSKDLVGRAAMAEKSEERVIFPDRFIRIPLEGTELLPEFFVAYWNSPQIRDFVSENAKTTSGIWKINQTRIPRMPAVEG